MRKTSKSEKLLLNDIFQTAKKLQKTQQDISIGQLISLIRSQLRISQRFLAKRSKVPQSTISKIESGILHPNIMTLHKILSAISCKLILSAFPMENLDIILRKQAHKKAEKKINYLVGTMALEQQQPDKKLIQELIQEEEEKILRSNNSNLWEEG
jgi:transcriptional regulator with XRE-family HTH domain